MAGGVGQGNQPRPFALSVGGLNLTRHVPLDMLGPVRISEALGSVPTLEFSVYDPTFVRSLSLLRWVTLTRGTFVHFGGWLSNVEVEQMPLGRGFRCTATGYEGILDRRIVPHYSSRTTVNHRVRRVSSDRQMVLQLMSRHGGQLIATSANVDETNAAMDIVDIEGTTLRAALEQVADVATTLSPETNRSFRVDHNRHLHWYSGTEGLTAPYRVGDGSYSTDVIDTTGLVEVFALRETAGNVYGGKFGTTGTVNGGVTYNVDGGVVNEPHLGAMQFFTANSSYVSATGASFHPGDTFSLECWFSRFIVVTAQAILSAGTNDYLMGFDATGHVWLQKEGTGDHFVSDNTYTDDDWHHLVWTRSPGNTDVYVDGASITGTTTARTFVAAAGAINIGRKLSTTSQYYDGALQQVAVYGNKLSAATVLAHYRQGISLSVENLSASYDSSDVRHRVYVKGTGRGTGWVDPGVHVVGTAFFDDIIDVGKDASTVAKRNAYGRAFIRANGRQDSFRFTVLGAYHGWKLGQTVTITDNALGLTADDKEIVELVTDFALAPGSGTPATAIISYELGLEKVRPSHYRGSRRRRRRKHRD